MNRNYIASELVKVAKEMVSSKYNNPIDQWLVDNGWKETGGIALYTNPKFPLVGIDTNSDTAAVEVFKSKSAIFNDEGSLVEYTDNLGKLKKAVAKGAMIGRIWVALKKKYPTYKAYMPTSSLSFFANRDDEVSFKVFTDNWTVRVGGYGPEGVSKRMSPNLRNILKFIEESQQKILAGGGERR